MGADLEVILSYGKHGIDKFCQRVATADRRQRMAVGRLKAQFDRDANVMLPSNTLKHIQVLCCNAVRPCGDGNLRNIWQRGRLTHIGFKLLNRKERIGIILEICNKLMGMIFLFNMLPCDI